MRNLSLILILGLFELSLALTFDSPIIIVGGGISGIAAANQLKTAGFKNITILEAQSRLGGRIQTISYGKFILFSLKYSLSLIPSMKSYKMSVKLKT